MGDLDGEMVLVWQVDDSLKQMAPMEAGYGFYLAPWQMIDSSMILDTCRILNWNWCDRKAPDPKIEGRPVERWTMCSGV